MDCIKIYLDLFKKKKKHFASNVLSLSLSFSCIQQIHIFLTIISRYFKALAFFFLLSQNLKTEEMLLPSRNNEP